MGTGLCFWGYGRGDRVSRVGLRVFLSVCRKIVSLWRLALRPCVCALSWLLLCVGSSTAAKTDEIKRIGHMRGPRGMWGCGGAMRCPSHHVCEVTPRIYPRDCTHSAQDAHAFNTCTYSCIRSASPCDTSPLRLVTSRSARHARVAPYLHLSPGMDPVAEVPHLESLAQLLVGGLRSGHARRRPRR